MTDMGYKVRRLSPAGSAVRVLWGWLVVFLLAGGCAGSYTGWETEDTAPLSAKEMRAGLRALLTPADFAECEALPDSQKSEWLRIFWQKHDPTPTTTENEFRREHFRRLRYALYYFSNPFGPIPWDDRGEVYIRYGEPNERTFMLNDFWDRRKALGIRSARLKGLSPTAAAERDFSEDAPGLAVSGREKSMSHDAKMMTNPRGPNGEVWYFYRFGLTFQFQDEEGLGIFSLVPYTDVFGSQDDYPEFVRTKITAVDLQPAIYLHDYGTAHLDYALDLARFRAPGKAFNVDVNLGYPLAELTRGGPDSAMISIRRVVVIRDDSLHEVAADLSILSRRVGASNGQQQLLVEQKIFNLPPGGYELSVAIEDLFSGKKGIYKKCFRLPEFITREVQEISDIELASFVWSVYEPGSPYVKSNRLVMPLPSHIYLQDQPIAFYYEIYNLAMNDRDTAVYSIKYEILDAQAKHVFHKENAGRFFSAERDVCQFGTIGEADLKPGEYLLSINVFDETIRNKKRTLTRFKVIPAGGRTGSRD